MSRHKVKDALTALPLIVVSAVLHKAFLGVAAQPVCCWELWQSVT